MVIFRALRTTLVHFADFVTGHSTSCAPCAVCHTPGALCTFIRAYSKPKSQHWRYLTATTAEEHRRHHYCSTPVSCQRKGLSLLPATGGFQLVSQVSDSISK